MPASTPRFASEPVVRSEFEERALRRITTVGGLIVDAGGGARFTKTLGRYRPWFEGSGYTTLDVSAATSPDLVGDIHALPFEDATVDAFLCRSVLEHVEDPALAVREMARALRPGGQLYLAVPSIYPYHARQGAGGYPDYWRFFEDSVRVLLEQAGFERGEIGLVGGPTTRWLYFNPVANRAAELLEPIAFRIDLRIGRRRGTRNVTELLAWAQK